MYLAELLVWTYYLNLLNVAEPPIFEARTLISRDGVFFLRKHNLFIFFKAGREEFLKDPKDPKSWAFFATSSEEAQR